MKNDPKKNWCLKPSQIAWCIERIEGFRDILPPPTMDDIQDSVRLPPISEMHRGYTKA